jgi:hypothetical protein
MTPRRRAALVAAAAIALAAGFVALRRARTPDEQRIRDAIAAVERACEEKDLGGVLERVSERYRDGDGLGKRELRGFLFAQFIGAKEGIGVARLGPTEVEMHGPSAATARFRAAISTGGGIATAVRGERWDFEVDFAKEGGDWLVISHRRRPAE